MLNPGGGTEMGHSSCPQGQVDARGVPAKGFTAGSLGGEVD